MFAGWLGKKELDDNLVAVHNLLPTGVCVSVVGVRVFIWPTPRISHIARTQRNETFLFESVGIVMHNNKFVDYLSQS